MQIKPKLEKYSIGIGDRFSHQAKAQLQAVIKASQGGKSITPVWNKSYREHQIIGSIPQTTRIEADRAVHELGWEKAYYTDADHINLNNVDSFLDSSDFFTIDVADYIGQKAEKKDVELFVKSNLNLKGKLHLPGLDTVMEISEEQIVSIAEKYLYAVQQAGNIYRYIAEKKGDNKFIAEVSMDETETPQSPLELLLILSALSAEKIPVQTIAPKFSGRFNKGVDYVGDVNQFKNEFEQDLSVIRLAIQNFELPENLKLSVHSGSDKFSIYSIMGKLISQHDCGLHLKTAGTTWLEELIGLAEAGGSGLEMSKLIYNRSLDHFDELCAPYATVIDIEKSLLPDKETVKEWTRTDYTSALRHDLSNDNYNLHFRQLLHVGYKVAAQLGAEFTDELKKNEQVIARNVSENIYSRHLKPLFLNQ